MTVVTECLRRLRIGARRKLDTTHGKTTTTMVISGLATNPIPHYSS